MIECIETRTPKARKEYVCEYCLERIPCGSKYHEFIANDGTGLYHFKSHIMCEFVATQLSNKYRQWDDGIDAYDFQEAVNDFFNEFIASKEVQCKTFSEQIKMVATVLKEYEFVQELKKPNKPYSKFWNPIKRYLKKRDSALIID